MIRKSLRVETAVYTTRKKAATCSSRLISYATCPKSGAQSAEAAASARNAHVTQNAAGMSRGMRRLERGRATTVTIHARTRTTPSGLATVAPAPSVPGRCSGNVRTANTATPKARRHSASARNAAAAIAPKAYFGEYTATVARATVVAAHRAISADGSHASSDKPRRGSATSAMRGYVLE